MRKLEIQNFHKIIEEFFEKGGFKTDIDVSLSGDKILKIKIKTEEPKILIGQNGQTLAEIQHLLKTILKKKVSEENFYIDLDINDYKKKKIEYLKETAKNIADEVALTKKERILSPMPAYERRIIHLELAERGDVTTQSIGKEPDRRVVIKPYP